MNDNGANVKKRIKDVLVDKISYAFNIIPEPVYVLLILLAIISTIFCIIFFLVSFDSFRGTEGRIKVAVKQHELKIEELNKKIELLKNQGNCWSEYAGYNPNSDDIILYSTCNGELKVVDKQTIKQQ